MVVISVAIEESEVEIIAGIPRSVSITASIPSNIYYTLDGTDPTIASSIVIDGYSIFFPLGQGNSARPDLLEITLKVLAISGSDSSGIITTIYSTNITFDTRLPHANVSGLNNASINSLFPFGTNSPGTNVQYTNSANSGTTVENPLLPLYPDGYDGEGNPSGFTNSPNPDIDYEFKYSETDSEGQKTPGVGNLPSKTTIIQKYVPEEYSTEISNVADKLFDPKAMVIFQDSSNNNNLDPPIINKQFFSLENQEIVRDGNLLYNSALDSPTTTGSFLRSHYNPTTKKMTYYYYDSKVNKWIISSTDYDPANNKAGNLSTMVFPREQGAGFVFRWHLFRYRTLF